jgi:hypothetical protein
MATQVSAPVRAPATRSRYYYLTFGLVVVALIFAGFAKTYYLKGVFGTAELPWLLHLHGLLMSAWLVLFLVQTTLVEQHRVDIHRKLGVFGAFLVATIVVVNPIVAVRAASLGHAPPGVPPLPFLAVPLFDVVTFAGCVIAALLYRRRPELHKRLMLVATISILGPGLGRIPIDALLKAGPLAYFGITDLILIAAAAYDWRKHGKLSPAFLWGGLFVIISHPLRLFLSGTSAWLAFAHWLTGV